MVVVPLRRLLWPPLSMAFAVTPSEASVIPQTSEMRLPFDQLFDTVLEVQSPEGLASIWAWRVA